MMILGPSGGAGYTVDKWLGDLNKRYGGIDKALIWPTYTQIGIDDRNTFELIESMPGGYEGIKAVVDQLHAKGVKVLWPYHPWDHSTHNQEKNNVTDYVSMAEMLKATDSDGFNGAFLTVFILICAVLYCLYCFILFILFILFYTILC